MSTESTSGGTESARVRASDAEREEYARIVREAVGEGRLGLDEGDERLAKLYAAKYRDELSPLITDLPEGSEYRQHGAGARRSGRGEPRSGRGEPRGGRGEPRGGEWRGGPPWGPPRSGAPWGGAPWGAGWRGRRRGPRGLFVLALAAVLVTIWVLSGAGFFWPLIPLAFLTFAFLRGACWARWYRHARDESEYSGQRRPTA